MNPTSFNINISESVHLNDDLLQVKLSFFLDSNRQRIVIMEDV